MTTMRVVMRAPFDSIDPWACGISQPRAFVRDPELAVHSPPHETREVDEPAPSTQRSLELLLETLEA
jgi:hypothetical protein